jgi:hypothetical protein
VTKSSEKTAVRRAARLLALLPALLVTLAAAPALAAPPEQWQDNPGTSPIHVLTVMLLIPLGVIALIALLVYIPSMSRGESYQPGLAWRSEPEWFGGPRKGVEAIDSTEQPAPSGGGNEERGGASGRW